jgi:hypothetical protein
VVGAVSSIFFGVFKMADIFAAVDLSGVATFAIAAGILVIGIAMAFKGTDLGKRAVRKA